MRVDHEPFQTELGTNDRFILFNLYHQRREHPPKKGAITQNKQKVNCYHPILIFLHWLTKYKLCNTESYNIEPFVDFFHASRHIIHKVNGIKTPSHFCLNKCHALVDNLT